jgi:hypothetical protein
MQAKVANRSPKGEGGLILRATSFGWQAILARRPREVQAAPLVNRAIARRADRAISASGVGAHQLKTRGAGPRQKAISLQ